MKRVNMSPEVLEQMSAFLKNAPQKRIAKVIRLISIESIWIYEHNGYGWSEEEAYNAAALPRLANEISALKNKPKTKIQKITKLALAS